MRRHAGDYCLKRHFKKAFKIRRPGRRVGFPNSKRMRMRIRSEANSSKRSDSKAKRFESEAVRKRSDFESKAKSEATRSEAIDEKRTWASLAGGRPGPLGNPPPPTTLARQSQWLRCAIATNLNSITKRLRFRIASLSNRFAFESVRFAFHFASLRFASLRFRIASLSNRFAFESLRFSLRFAFRSAEAPHVDRVGGLYIM